MIEIGPGVYIETIRTQVTVGAILTDEGWVCIDTPPMPRDAQAWRTSLRDISHKPVRYLINTDHHRDRILGNIWFDAPVVAHAISARQMHDLKGPFLAQAAEEMSADDNELVAIASLHLSPPQISYSDSLSLMCGDHEIVLQHRPSATLGTTWVALNPERILFAGDSVVDDQHPTISDGASKPWLNWLSDLRRERYANWIVVPGRGEPIQPAETEALSEYLRVARRRIASLCRAGRPRSEVGALVAEFLPLFPIGAAPRDELQRRIRAGLEAIYEEVRGPGGDEDEQERESLS